MNTELLDRSRAVELLLALRQEVELLCAPLRHAPPVGDEAPTQLLWLIELHNKLEEQWLYPALQQGVAPLLLVQPATLQIELLRELAHRWEHGPPTCRPVVLALLDGLAQAHFALVDAVIDSTQGWPRREGIDWRKLHDDMQAMLARWRDEVRATGDIEDEESDPVGHPPR